MLTELKAEPSRQNSLLS